MLHRTLGLLSVVAFASVLEITGTWSLWGDVGGGDLLAALAAHAIASALLAWVLVALLRGRIPSLRLSAAYLICFLTPLLSLFVVLTAAVILRLAPETTGPSRSAEFLTVPPSSAVAGALKAWERATADVYDEAGLASVLKWSRDPERRCRAVLKSARLSERESIRLLRLALRDPEDEVRLLAYGLLEHKTQSLASRMREHAARLSAAATPAESWVLHRALAYEAWRMVNLGLAQGEVSGHY